MKEVWKDVLGYEGLYQVSNLGRVKSLFREVHYKDGRIGHFPEMILRQGTNHKGYKVVYLSKSSSKKTALVHRLVAKAFIPNPNSLPQINHKDEDKVNNTADNLEWCNAKYNNNYGGYRERMSKTLTNGPLAKSTQQFDLKGKLIKVWPSTIEIQRQLGFFASNIQKCCVGKIKTAYGYKWRYSNAKS